MIATLPISRNLFPDLAVAEPFFTFETIDGDRSGTASWKEMREDLKKRFDLDDDNQISTVNKKGLNEVKQFEGELKNKLPEISYETLKYNLSLLPKKAGVADYNLDDLADVFLVAMLRDDVSSRRYATGGGNYVDKIDRFMEVFPSLSARRYNYIDFSNQTNKAAAELFLGGEPSWIFRQQVCLWLF